MTRKITLHAPKDWSNAFRSFHNNVAGLIALLDTVHSPTHELERQEWLESLDPEERRRLGKWPSGRKSERLADPAYRERLKRTSALGRLWGIAMVVTAVEAYLQDILTLFAGCDQRVMQESKQMASYADVASASRVEDLSELLRSRWARNWIDRGGPPLWISRLEQMGSGPYSNGLGEELDRMWGIRHLVVHRAGVVDSDFLRRHPDYPGIEGKFIELDGYGESRYTDLATSFVRPTDQYFTARMRALKNKAKGTETR